MEKIRFAQFVRNEIKDHRAFDIAWNEGFIGPAFYVLTSEEKHRKRDKYDLIPDAWLCGDKTDAKDNWTFWGFKEGWFWNRKKKVRLYRESEELLNLTEAENEMLYDLYMEAVATYEEIVKPKLEQDVADRKEARHWWP